MKGLGHARTQIGPNEFRNGSRFKPHARMTSLQATFLGLLKKMICVRAPAEKGGPFYNSENLAEDA